MSLITVTDVAATMPPFTFNSTSVPTDAQVQKAIASVEATLRAWFVGDQGVWPTDSSSDIALAIAAGELIGVKVQVFDAIYGVVGDQGVPEGKRAAEREWQDWLKNQLPPLIRASRRSVDPAGRTTPLLGTEHAGQYLTGSYADYVERRDRREQVERARYSSAHAWGGWPQ